MRFDTATAASRALPSPTSFVFVFVVVVIGMSSSPSSSPSAVAVSAAYSGSIIKNVAVPGLRGGMDYCKLGTSDLLVSKVCMGTMTYGKQNTLEEGVEQLNVAFDEYGVNFIDTAEIYPTPPSEDTLGLTDKTISSFLGRGGRRREDVILATKVAGPGVTWLPRKDPDTPSRLTGEQILYSVDESLRRLGTDYVDLLQLHWPDRYAGGIVRPARLLPVPRARVGGVLRRDPRRAPDANRIRQGATRGSVERDTLRCVHHDRDGRIASREISPHRLRPEQLFPRGA